MGKRWHSLTVCNNKLFFAANDSTHGYELWSSDGTTAGTAMIADIYPGTGSSDPAYYSPFYAFNNKVYFYANDGTHGYELWVTDGTTGGTSMVADIYPGPGSSSVTSTGFITYNNKIYFNATDSVHGYELWTSDGTTAGTVLFDDIWPGTGNSSPANFTAYNNKFYFSANDSVH